MNLDSFRLIAAPHTPFCSDGRLNTTLVPAIYQRLIDTGVHGAFIAGTTGEGLSMTLKERMSLLEAWVKCKSKTAFELIVHVGHDCVQDAIVLAAHANSCGASAVAALAPSDYKPPSVAAMIDYCEPIARAARDLPFYLYDVPVITGVDLPASAFLSAGNERISNLAGVKYTNPNLSEMQLCVQHSNRKYDVLWGFDEALLAGISMGASGAVGGTYCFAAPQYFRILDAIANNSWQLAREEQAKVVELVAILFSNGGRAGLKYAMRAIGIDCGPLRFPQENLTTSQERELQAALERIDFHRFTCP